MLRARSNQELRSWPRVVRIFILISFLALLLAKASYWLPRDVYYQSGINLWCYTDWLVDYSAGFTRRGLSGEMLAALNRVAPPVVVIGTVGWLVFFAVVAGYLRLLIKSVHLMSAATLAAMLFLPSLLPFYLYDHNAFGRKEVLGFLIVLWHLWSIERICGSNQYSCEPDLHRYAWYLLPVTTVMLPALILMHEATALLFMPVQMMLTNSVLVAARSTSLRQRSYYVLVAYSPAMLALFGILLWGRPDVNVAHAICSKWEALNALPRGICAHVGEGTAEVLRQSSAGALTALPWTISQSASLVRSLRPETILYWLLDFLVLGLVTAYFCRQTVQSLMPSSIAANTAKRRSDISCLKYYVLPLLVSSPLYLLGWDWGRWFAVCSVNYAMVSLCGTVNRLGGLQTCTIGRPAIAKQELARRSMPMVLGSTLFSFTMLILTVVLLRLPHCCISWENMLRLP